MSRIEENARALLEFCRDSSAVEAFNLDRTTGPDPAFCFLDAAGRLVVGEARIEPAAILVVTPTEEGFHLSLVKASKHAAPFLVAMEHHDAHEDVVGTFPTPDEAFEVAVGIVDEPEATHGSPRP
ncbi:hypothetical protein BHAOGJBA_4225 [Methylobacterium hispanicum]|uniref:Uncharacterized protein n=1 Tax=Methylobacterium hispanicum TaxID=270350 RepID=A0AAV4ZQZ2_9HYPH|nr:hypothetical protein [Methylobacterium hispanicum]GJD90683.1 hypothetical protein BHAOGJBA_4225 [Methylobacterium hispanicum]